jgi:hypothetical protein
MKPRVLKFFRNLSTFGIVLLIFGLATPKQWRYRLYHIYQFNQVGVKFEDCLLTNSKKFGNGGVFAICHSWSENGGRDIFAYVYDSSGLINRDRSEWSTEWRGAVKAVGSKAASGAFLRNAFYCSRIYGKFYVVQFDWRTNDSVV